MSESLWRSPRLIFRAVEDDDDEFLNALSGDPAIHLNSSHFLPVPTNKKAAVGFRDYLNKCLMNAVFCLPPAQESTTSDGGSTTSAKPIPIGFIALHAEDSPMLTHHRKSDIGIQLLKDYQGQGYGTEAIKWCLEWGFRRANLHRISIGAFAWNEGAIRLYERLGFIMEARHRDFFWHDGRYHDAVGLAMLEHEWRERYGKERVAVAPS